MAELFYCPVCSSELERLYGCGSEGYVCNKCRKTVSRKSILSEKEMVIKVVKLVTKTLKEENTLN